MWANISIDRRDLVCVQKKKETRSSSTCSPRASGNKFILCHSDLYLVCINKDIYTAYSLAYRCICSMR